MARRQRFVVRGQVQGVGFRPFVFGLAEEYSLTGFVRNSPRGVVIEVQGPGPAIKAFAAALVDRLPPLARITSLKQEGCAIRSDEDGFVIAPSTAGDSHAVLVSPDIATCPDCLADIADSGNRRHGYAFTNCTNCGPRYSITRSIPYDRASTSMACFPMCPDCLAEYQNPRDRRFHAQPNACAACGPEVVLVSSGGGERETFEKVSLSPPPDPHPSPFKTFCSVSGIDAIEDLATVLLEGRIAAIKGLGGFHLACDACDEAATALLRERKHRPHKPFAVMVADMAEARHVAFMGEEEERLLGSRERPIVICGIRPGALAAGVSPDTASVGLMLPYTPLHSLLFEALRRHAAPSRPLALVMTSGNPGGEPICLGNREALSKLGGMADVFLLHNRDILIRVDDSVVRCRPGRGPLFYRRARGYVPEPVTLAQLSGFMRPGKAPQARDKARAENDSAQAAGKETGQAEEASRPCVLGVGPELKNTLCFTKGDDAFVSQHIGDMGNLETAAFHAEIRAHMAALLKVEPGLVVRDLHPDYLSSVMAEEWAKEKNIPVLALQHHFAHAHAVLAEHAFSGRAIVLALDGTGLGEDGKLWGGEILYVDCSPDCLKREGKPRHERLASFAPMDLPGGEAAIREPWRIAHALLLHLRLGADLIAKGLKTDPDPGQLETRANAGPHLPWLPEYTDAARLLPVMLERRFNCPASTSCGRLFDAVAALLGLCNATTYEGQAAIRLEEAQWPAGKKEGQGQYDPLFPLKAGLAPTGKLDEIERPVLYPCPVEKGKKDYSGCLRLDTHSLFAALFADWAKATPVRLIARRFHASLSAGLVRAICDLAKERGVEYIGLSGGCLQNMTLADQLAKGLEAGGLTPLLHKVLPPGDACISLGQAAWGRYVMSVPDSAKNIT